MTVTLRGWTDVGNGTCKAKTENEDGTLCGHGEKKQIRNCTDGTEQNCTSVEKERTIPCDEPNPLPACVGK